MCKSVNVALVKQIKELLNCWGCFVVSSTSTRDRRLYVPFGLIIRWDSNPSPASYPSVAAVGQRMFSKLINNLSSTHIIETFIVQQVCSKRSHFKRKDSYSLHTIIRFELIQLYKDNTQVVRSNSTRKNNNFE